MIKIDIDTVAELLTRVARGERPAATSHDGLVTWTIRVDGFVIEIFDDADKVDYVQRVTDQAGRTVLWTQYMNAYGFDPVERLTAEHREKLSEMMISDYVRKTMPLRKR